MSDPAHLLTNSTASHLKGWDALPFLEKVTRIAPGIIYVFNQKTLSNEYSNHSLGELLGYSVEQIQAMGAEFMPRLCHPDDFESVLAHFVTIQNLKDGEVGQIEYRMKHHAGHWVWLLSNDTVFDRDEDGSVLRHIGVATDITAQKTAEATANYEKRVANEANEELRSFAYSVSHDLKAPSNTLAMLISELEDAHDGTANPEEVELLDLCRQTVNRMQTLIEDVLHYTQVVGEEQTPSTVNLADIVHDVVTDLDAQITAASAQIQIGDLPCIPGNATQLRILFQNLITNAVRYCDPQVTPEVTVSCTSRSDENQVVISVKDNGIGIDPKMHERIFKLFARLHREQEYPGTGLGLATCRRIATNHGGEITVVSAPGVGSTFSVILPV